MGHWMRWCVKRIFKRNCVVWVVEKEIKARSEAKSMHSVEAYSIQWQSVYKMQEGCRCALAGRSRRECGGWRGTLHWVRTRPDKGHGTCCWYKPDPTDSPSWEHTPDDNRPTGLQSTREHKRRNLHHAGYGTERWAHKETECMGLAESEESLPPHNPLL